MKEGTETKKYFVREMTKMIRELIFGFIGMSSLIY
jgi:hypothetical protein